MTPPRLLSLALLTLLPVPLAAQAGAPVPGCVLERIAAGVSSNGLAIDADGDRVFFISNEDPLGTNPGFLNQVFLWREGRGFDRLVGTNRARTGGISADASGRRIAFVSDAPLTPGNRDRNQQVFLWDAATGTRQITDHDLDEVFEASIDASGTRIVFVRWVIESPLSNPVRYDLVLWEEGSGERVIASSGLRLDNPLVGDQGRVVTFVRSSPAGGAEPAQIRSWDEDTGIDRPILFLDPDGTPSPGNLSLDGDGDRLVFASPLDLAGDNPDGGLEIFLWDAEEEGVRQITDSGSESSFAPSISADGRAVAFLSSADPLGSNPHGLRQVFLWRERADGETTLTQVTAWEPGPNPDVPGGALFQVALSEDGRRIAHALFQLGPPGDPEATVQGIWLADCAAPAPPYDGWLTSPELPGFEVQVRIGGERQGVEEPLCIEETLCVSGAVAGRSEVFVRIVGPKPNGRLWPTLVKFTTAEVEVWIRQLSTGEVEHYRLRGASPGFDELPGLFDREGFEP